MRLKHIIIIFIFLSCVATAAEASDVYVRGQRGSWYLEVDGSAFYVKGAGCGIALGRDNTDYLRMAKELGANSVRTWGTDQGTQEYLDLAHAYGLKVAAGIWLNYVTDQGDYSYRFPTEYVKAKRREALDYVQRFKHHPAVLFWIVGNEAIFFTRDEGEKIALCRFLEELVQEIQKIDPKHPVVYASAGIADLKYLKEYVPSLDVIGVNEYGSVRTVHGTWEHLGFEKPYIFTEFGHYLNIDRPKDLNRCSIELSDENKAKRYSEAYCTIFSFKGFNLGGFAFHLGETSQESMTWWNLNEGRLKRASFWKIYELYTGLKAPCAPVRITRFMLSKSADVSPGEEVEAHVTLGDDAGEGLSFDYAASSAQESILRYYVNEYYPLEVYGQGPTVMLKAPKARGTYRVYCFIRDEKGNVSSANTTLRVK